ncbi:VWA domain-containing protein [Vibrio fortis]|uniref:VWA domain-containing protein n=1 Tax=Vibrio fortis TaxID=212667 RepID=A0A5N3S162_9VIBR|nr:VWA domain-containing protein [Vibrio fortis]KAB0300568.1 VWA domain-containing protein [Vibrio fortis]
MLELISPSFELEHPLWLVILPLPFLVYFAVPAYRTKQMAIKVPFFRDLVDAIGETPSEGASQLTPSWWQRVTLIVTWILVVCALAKPTILGEPQIREQFGRDVMVVVDLSGSMAEEDFTSKNGERISRLDATKEVLSDFAKTRQGDRLGLILFGDAAFVQTPFTADQSVWLELLNQTDVAMAGQSTHLGDAIGLAIKVFEQSHNQRDALSDQVPEQDREKVVIVLTDGNDTGSFVEPIDAAKVAKAKGVRIHVIAMGDPQTVGEVALDMETIRRIAEESGGSAFEALNRDELQKAYAEIGELEPQLYESTTYRPKQTIHHHLMAIVVVMYLTAFSAATMRRRNLLRKAKQPLVQKQKQGEQNV